jgi:hypothetical protein
MVGEVGGVKRGVGGCELSLQGQYVLSPALVQKRSLYSVMKACCVRSCRPLLNTRTNQWLEQYLRIYGNFQQDDWVSWLPIAQFVHNSWSSETTKQTPFELLIGHTPTVGPIKIGGKIPDIDRRKEHLSEKCN